ncbi:hypothetical protein QR680_001277 [Steinernema hermaphroditum]|uniref:C-type lectin domain-containing protein n=1 Tax=Steinernema hermaphroditum TaxID=289476 RepID=A0AA39H0D7_9BILA|nr:hypothetical protein QR680_001277 [Steinernema hermaphroditum]
MVTCWSSLLVVLGLLFGGSFATDCFDGFFYSPIKEKCVKFFTTQKSWSEAEASCQSHSGHLISIESAFENTAVAAMVRDHTECKDAWTGGKWSNGSFVWSDGSPFRYQNFENRISNPEACVASQRGSMKWNSISCKQTFCYICEKPTNTPTDCMDIKEAGNTKSGLYTVFDGIGKKTVVYCDMDTQGGGWTVIQQRTDGRVRFWNRTWDEYKKGFGTPSNDGEFWIGNEIISRISTKDESVTLRVDLWGDRAPNSSHVNDYYYSEYDFSLGDESSNFTIEIKTPWPGVGNASTGWYDITYSNGRPFSTVDRINDPAPECVRRYHLSGWWLHECTLSSLNGEYIPPIRYGDGYGMTWLVDGYYFINPRKSRMMIRRGSPSSSTQSLFFTDLLGTYLESQPVLFIVVFLSTLALVFSFVFNFIYVLFRFGCDKCKPKRYQQHPTSTSLYVVLLFLFYFLWVVAAAATVIYIYVAFIQKGSTHQTEFESDSALAHETQGVADVALKLLNDIRDISYAKNPLYNMEWIFDNVVRYVILMNPVILVFAAYATVVGTICYKNSRHPMDRSTTSNVMHNILAVCSGSTLFILSALLMFASASFLYAHATQNTCQDFQMRMQNDNIEQFLNARNVSDADITMITEVLADIEEDRKLANQALCVSIAEPFEVICLLTTILAASSFLLMFIMNSLSKFYMQVDSIYYWNPEDPYSTLRMFQCNKDCFPPLPVLPMK